MAVQPVPHITWENGERRAIWLHPETLAPMTATIPDPPVPSPPVTVFYPGPYASTSGDTNRVGVGFADHALVFPAALHPGLGAGYDDATAINWALASAGPYGRVQLVPGAVYTTYSPIVMPAGVTLDGGVFGQATANDIVGLPTTTGTIIKAAASFTGAAMIQQVNSTATRVPGCNLAGFTLEGNSLPAGSGVVGILLQGGVWTGSMNGVMVHRPDGDCLQMVADPTSGLNPDDWQVVFSKFSSSRSGRGVHLSSGADCWFAVCEASENASDGWYWNVSGNIRFSDCKGENNAGAGFSYGGGAYAILTGCTTQYNQQDGFFFTGGTGPGGVVATGCRSWQDGRAGGTVYAGFRADAYAGRVMATGCETYADATGPAYGASETGASYGMCFTGSALAGVTAATHDDGTNTHALVNQSPVPF